MPGSWRSDSGCRCAPSSGTCRPSTWPAFRIITSLACIGSSLADPRIGSTNNRLERSERIIEPMTLVFRWRSWYLFAYRREKEDYRLFRLSRIRDPELLAQRFRRREKTSDEYPKENGTWPADNTAVAYGAVALAHILRKEAEHGGA